MVYFAAIIKLQAIRKHILKWYIFMQLYWLLFLLQALIEEFTAQFYADDLQIRQMKENHQVGLLNVDLRIQRMLIYISNAEIFLNRSVYRGIE